MSRVNCSNSDDATELVLSDVILPYKTTEFRFTQDVTFILLNGGRRVYVVELDWTSGINDNPPPIDGHRSDEVRAFLEGILLSRMTELYEGHPGLDGSIEEPYRSQWMAVLKLFDWGWFISGLTHPQVEDFVFLWKDDEKVLLKQEGDDDAEMVSIEVFDTKARRSLSRMKFGMAFAAMTQRHHYEIQLISQIEKHGKMEFRQCG